MYYPSNIPYLTTTQRTVLLDRGTPPRQGNIVFLLTKSRADSLELASQKTNFSSNGYMVKYFYPYMYTGKIGNKTYRINHRKIRKALEKNVQNAGLRMYPEKTIISSTEKYNTYYDLATYLNIYYDRTASLSPLLKVKLFWSMLTPIFMDSYGNLKNKYVLIDASKFPLILSGTIKAKIENPLYLFYVTMYSYFELVENLDIDFLIFAGNRVMKINFSNLKKNESKKDSKEDGKKYANKYLIELRKLYKAAVEDVNPKEIEYEKVTAEEEEQKISNEKVKVVTVQKTAAGPIISEVNAIQKVAENIAQIEDKAIRKQAMKSVHKLADSLEEDSLIDAVTPDEDQEPDEDESNKVDNDDSDVVNDSSNDDDADDDKKEEESTEAIISIYNRLTSSTTPSQRSSARDELLRKEQGKIQVKGTTIEDLAKINPKEREIKKTDVSKTTYSANPNIKEVRFNNFNESYVQECMPKDIVGVFENLNTKSIKMYIRDIKVKDSSTVTDLKETWTIYLEDEQRTRHPIVVDIPKFHDKNFMWLGGNDRNIKNQLFYLPIVKISEDTVMVVSNYNKMTMNRVGGRSFLDTSLISKIANKDEAIGQYFTKGSATGDNLPYITILEYDDYARSYVKFKHGGVTLYFDQKEATSYAESHSITIPEKYLFIGMEHDKPIFMDIDKQVTDDDRTISDIILSALPEESVKKYHSLQMKPPKTLAYTSITTMKQKVPLAVLICVWEGMTSLLDKSKVEYKIVDKLTSSTIQRNEGFIKFKDCIVVYKKNVPVELLFNGIKALETEKYTLEEMNTITPYIPYIEKKYGKISILNALNNVYEFTIGPIEKELLLDLKLPTDLVELLIYGNSLLADSQYISELNMTEYRVRAAEIIPAILYDCIAKAYVPYKNSSGKKKLSIPQDAVIKKLLALETVESTSTLNPFLELETTHGVSTKGWRGVNLEDSYTVPKRCYDDTMRGIIGVSGSPDAQIGVNRTLSMEPNIKSVRGYINTTDNMDELKDVNMFSPSELLIPLGATRDDPIRIGHSVKQSRACVPIENSSPVLMSNGSDESCKNYLSSNFVVMADQDGTVIEYDEVAKLMVVEYKGGAHRAINLDKNIVKNGGGGFELSNVLVTDLKVGDKFKANETLAWHDKFFKKIPTQGVRMCVGALVKVALYSLYNTYEDGTFICESVSDKCATSMVHKEVCVLGKNANVFSMVKVGDEVRVGQPLIEFDESFAEKDINSLLATLGDDEELKDVLIQNNKNSKKSDGGGVVEDIKIYAASDLEELSPSLRKIVGDYYDRINRKHKILNKYDQSEGILKCGMLLTESGTKTEPNRYGVIRGEKVYDGVLIEFHIKHPEPLEVGSKLANFSPLKNENGEIIPVGYEPRSEFRPNEIVETVISPTSILARMVGSVYPTIFGNKIVIELKRGLYVIYTGPGDYATKRKKMLKLIYDVFNAMDPSGANTRKYKNLFEPMSEAKWKSFWKEFFENDDHYLIFEMVDYEVNLTIENIEKAAKVLGVPLYEYVEFSHINMDAEHPIVTPHRVPVGYIHIKRPQQTVMHKNGMSTGTGRRAGITNQVTGEDKNGRESDLENCMLTSMGMTKTLKELNGPRADDSVAEKEMLQSIAEKGYVNLSDLTDDVANKATLNAVNTYFLGMGLQTDLLGKGLKLPKAIEQE